LTTVSLESQTAKSQADHIQKQLNEAQTTIINLKTNLADSNRETTEINSHYKQLLLESATVNATKTNLETENQKLQDEQKFVRHKHTGLQNLYEHAISVASSVNSNEFAESNKQLFNDIERITTENIKYENTIRNLKERLTSLKQYVPSYENLQAQFRILEEANHNLIQQNLKLDADLQNSKLAHQEALVFLAERDEQDVSFASATDQEEQLQQEIQQPQQSPSPQVSAFFIQQEPNAVPQKWQPKH
jgi:chromosome segregation ATPase